MIKNISITAALLAIPFFLLGPFMALMPRMMMLFLIFFALVLLPFLRTHWGVIKKNFNLQACIALALTLTYAVISVAWSPSPKALLTAIDITYVSLCCCIVFLALPFTDAKTLDRLTSLFAAGFVIGSGLMVFESFNNQPLHRWYMHLTPTEIIGDNVAKRMAAIFALGIWPFALWLKIKGKTVLSIISVLVFLGISVFLTNRSSLLGMVVGTAVLFFAFYQAALARWALMMFITLGLFFIVPVSIYLPLMPQEVTGQLFDSAQHRTKIWTATAQHVLEAPLQGHGLDASKGLETDMGDGQTYFKAGVSVISQHPHNIFLQIWLDFGFAGAVLWGILLLMLVDRIRFVHDTVQPYLLAGAYCSMMMLNTTFSLVQPWWSSGHIVCVMLMMMMSYSLSRKTEISGTSAGGIS